MSYSLEHAQSFKRDFTYLIGSSQSFVRPGAIRMEASPADIVKGIIIVGDDGACISEQMQSAALQKAILDDNLIIRKPWLFRYRVYLIHGQQDNPEALYYRDLGETLDQLGISFTNSKYSH
jgi:hypothetical protein